MSDEYIKFYKFGKVITIIELVTFSLLLICSILLIIFYPIAWAVGVMLFLICIAPLLYILLSSFFVRIDVNSLIEMNAFGKIKKSHQLTELREIIIKHGTSKSMWSDYLCFIFSDKDYLDKTCDDLLGEDDVTLLIYTKKNEAKIKEYTDLPIIDKRNTH